MKKLALALLIMLMAACGNQQQPLEETAEILDAGRSWWVWEQDMLFSENFIIRLYYYIDWINDVLEYEYWDFEVEFEEWQAQAAEAILVYTGIEVADLWYEQGTRLIADLTPETAVFFNWGTHGGHMRTRSLISSLFSFPNVTEIEVLVGGQRGVWADHFSFAQVFKIEEWVGR
jgi:hypothetical protein